MRKLLYITNGIKGAGGLERVLSVKASYLAEKLNYDVHIVVLNNNQDSFFYNFSDKIKIHDIKAIGSVFSFYNSYTKGIKEVVKKVQPHVICVCDDGLKGFFIPILLSKKYPIIYERHASILHNTTSRKFGKLKQSFMRFLGRTFSKFVVLTSSNEKEWSLKNSQIIPNPLSFYPQESSSLTHKKMVVVGTHSYNKGYDLLLQVWKNIVLKFPEWNLSIYGKIDSNKTFIQLAKELNIDTSVSFYHPISNIQEVYLNASLLILPSRTEGFGMVLIEAMSCGLPCVAFDCPSGPRDIIKTNEDGILVSPENVSEMTEKIIFLIENEEKLKQMGAQAKINVKRYLPDQIMLKWDQLFKDLIP